MTTRHLTAEGPTPYCDLPRAVTGMIRSTRWAAATFAEADRNARSDGDVAFGMGELYNKG